MVYWEKTGGGIAQVKRAMERLRDPREQRNGIRGWLLVFAIILCVTILQGVRAIYEVAIFYSSLWFVLPYAVLLVLFLLCFIQLLRRKIMFRKFFVAAVAVNVALACFAAIVQKNPTVLLSNVAGLLWCVYLYRSDRVRITCGLPAKRSGIAGNALEFAAARAVEAERTDAEEREKKEGTI